MEAPATSPDSAGQIEEETNYIKALCNAAGGDGTASKVERDHIIGVSSVKGYLPEAMETIHGMCDAAENKTMEDMAADAKNAMSIGTLRFAAGSIVFEAIKAASKVRSTTFWYIRCNDDLYHFTSQSLAPCFVEPRTAGRS